MVLTWKYASNRPPRSPKSSGFIRVRWYLLKFDEECETNKLGVAPFSRRVRACSASPQPETKARRRRRRSRRRIATRRQCPPRNPDPPVRNPAVSADSNPRSTPMLSRILTTCVVAENFHRQFADIVAGIALRCEVLGGEGLPLSLTQWDRK
jgi:hypothetical protein